MKIVTINGKKIRIRGTLGRVRDIVERYDIPNMLKLNDRLSDMTEIEHIDFITEIFWAFVEPRWFFKPYLTKKRFQRHADHNDVVAAVPDIYSELYGINVHINKDTKEDGDSPNVN